MTRSVPILLLIALGVSRTAWCQSCVDAQQQPTLTTSSIIINNTNFPDDFALQNGAAAWNDTGCNTNHAAFPVITFGSQPANDARFITVNYDPGPNNQPVCGSFAGSTITLYGSATLGSGAVVSCGGTATLSQNFEHELGHAFGLGESSCAGYIMSGISIDAGGNYNQRSIQGDECNAVNTMQVTPVENAPPGGGGCDGRFFEIAEDCSPILVNMGNGPYRLTGQSDPVSFDIAASGVPARVTWTAGGADEAFLWIDRNDNGVVDDGGELFGNATTLRNGQRAANGFEALRELDDNHDGRIDENDRSWRELMLWRDLNHDGVSQWNEIVPVSASLLTAVSLDYHWTGRRDLHGNMFRFEAKAWLGAVEPRPRPIYDVYFVVIN